MADNFIASPGLGGDTFAADEIVSVKYPRSKVGFGADGYYTDVSDSSRLPVSQIYGIATGGTCQELSISSTQAQSAAITGTIVEIVLTTDAYVREGASPVAVNNGTDHFFVQNCVHTVKITSGNKLSFITKTLTGTARIAVVA